MSMYGDYTVKNARFSMLADCSHGLVRYYVVVVVFILLEVRYEPY